MKVPCCGNDTLVFDNVNNALLRQKTLIDVEKKYIKSVTKVDPNKNIY